MIVQSPHDSTLSLQALPGEKERQNSHHHCIPRTGGPLRRPWGDEADPSALICHPLLLLTSPHPHPSSPGTTAHTADAGPEMGTSGRRCDIGLGSAGEKRQPESHPRGALDQTEMQASCRLPGPVCVSEAQVGASTYHTSPR